MCKRCNRDGRHRHEHSLVMSRSIRMSTHRVRRETVALLLGSILCMSAPSLGTTASPSTNAAPQSSHEFSMKIRMNVEGEIVTATLDDTVAGRDFAALLPMSLTLKDYAVIERISDLPHKLATTDAPAGIKPETGDITYYAPWGNLAIFVRGNVYAPGLVRLGKVDSGLPALQRSGPLKVKIERITQ